MYFIDIPRTNIDLGFSRTWMSFTLTTFNDARMSLSSIVATVIRSSIDDVDLVFTNSTLTLMQHNHRPNNVEAMLLCVASPTTFDTITISKVM